MEGVLTLSVPLVVEVNSGRSWAEAHWKIESGQDWWHVRMNINGAAPRSFTRQGRSAHLAPPHQGGSSLSYL